MSGGGTVPKAPDLSSQTAQANQTFGTATSDAAQTNATAAAANAQTQATVGNITGQETPMVGAVNNSANQNLSTYGSTFVPLQQQQAAQAQNWGSESNVANMQGRAEADQNAASDAAINNQKASLAAEGVDPASIQGSAIQAQQRTANAAAVAGAGNNAAVNTQLQSQQLTNQANQLGLQVNAAGDTGAATGSNIGAQTAGTVTNAGASETNNTTAGVGELNAATGANNSALTSQQDQFGDQVQQAQAQAAQNSSMMSSIGSIAGAAAMFMEKGGPVPHGTPTSGIPPRFMNPKGAAGLMRDFYEGGGPVRPQGALPMSPVPGSTDTKPAMLTPDEFVIPRDAATWKGHEHWYKQIDKAREDMGVRKGLPPRPSSALTMRGA